MSKFVKPYLFLSAAVLLFVGVMLSFAPEALYASSAHILPDSTMIRSDLRADGVVVLISGLFVLGAALRGRDMQPALLLSLLIYAGYGLGRIVSIGFDGTPDAALIIVTVTEWAFVLGALILLRRRQSADTAQPMAAH